MCVHIQITSKQHFHKEDDDQRKKNDDAKLDEREKKKKDLTLPTLIKNRTEQQQKK